MSDIPPTARFTVGDKVRVKEDTEVDPAFQEIVGAEGTVVLHGDGSTDNPTWIGDNPTSQPDYAYWVDIGIKMEDGDPITEFLNHAKSAHGIPETAWSFFEYELEALDA